MSGDRLVARIKGVTHPRISISVWLRAVVLWHLIVAGTSAVAYVPLIGRPGGGSPFATWTLPILLTVWILANLRAAQGVARRRHSGRALSLGLNYLGLIAALLFAFHRVGIFIGIDALGGTFGRGVPWLLTALVGYLVLYAGDRLGGPHSDQPIYRRIGLILLGISGVAFLLAVGLIPALTTLLSRLVFVEVAYPFLAAGLFGVFAWRMWKPEMTRTFGSSTALMERLDGFLFLSPNVLGFLIFFAGPLLFSLFVSFTSWDAFGPKIWIGLDNYIRIFSLDVAHLASGSQPAGEVLKEGYNELFRLGDFVIGARDKLFWISIRNILMFAVLAIPLAVAPALLLANVLNSKIPGMKFFRAIYFIPSVAGVVGIALVWRQLFNATVGFINFFITKAVGFLDALPGFDIRDPEIKWLSDSSTALIAVVIVFAWQMVGFNTVLYLAGLQGIPRDLYEAATIDGANKWQRFRHITIPMLTPTTFFVVASTSILALQLFTEPFIMFSPASGPNNATLTPVVYLYQQGFQRFSQGYASAVAWVLFGLIFVFTLTQFRRQRNADGAYGAA